MSNELERAYQALARDAAERSRMLPAAELRGRARRQTVVRSAAGLVAVAVLAAGATIGVRVALAGGSPSPQPILPAAPSAVPPVSSAPVASTPVSSAPPSGGASEIPESIPASAMLTKADGNTGEFSRLEDVRPEPELCAAAVYPSAAQAAVRASVSLMYRSPELGPEYVPNDQVYNTVTVYRGGGADQFLADLRAAVKDCPTGKSGSLDATFRSLGSMSLGDESLLVEKATQAYGDDGTPSQGKRRTYIAAVRVGDSVTLIETLGYESAPSERTDVEAFAKTATDRLKSWRP
jgi:hypothetical protein